MHFKPHALGLATAVLAAICYGLDSLFYALAPEQSMTFWGFISHNLDFSVLVGDSPTWGSFVAGLIVWTVSSYIGGWLFAWLYNKFAK